MRQRPERIGQMTGVGIANGGSIRAKGLHPVSPCPPFICPLVCVTGDFTCSSGSCQCHRLRQGAKDVEKVIINNCTTGVKSLPRL